MAKLSKTGKIIIGGTVLAGAGLLLKKLFFDKKEEEAPQELTEGEEYEDVTEETDSENENE